MFKWIFIIKRLMMQASDDSPNVNVFTASRNRWKRLRTISNQAFSPLKLKEVYPMPVINLLLLFK